MQNISMNFESVSKIAAEYLMCGTGGSVQLERDAKAKHERLVIYTRDQPVSLARRNCNVEQGLCTRITGKEILEPNKRTISLTISEKCTEEFCPVPYRL